VNSPGNPTGWIMEQDQQRELLDFCRERGIYVISDEVYIRLIYDRPRAPSFLDICEPDDPVIVINSFSKTWSMTGWRLGWLTHPPHLGPDLSKLNEFNVASPTTFVQHAGVTAIREGEGFVAEMVEGYRRNRDLVFQRLAAMPKVRLSRPEGAFYAFFAVDGMTDSFEYAKQLIAETGVGLAPGRAFGPEGEGWMRLCFAAEPDTLSEALDRLEPARRYADDLPDRAAARSRIRGPGRALAAHPPGPPAGLRRRCMHRVRKLHACEERNMPEMRHLRGHQRV
jgi:aspartate aminotransferase